MLNHTSHCVIDTASMGRLRVLTPEMQVYRRPEVHICALTDIVSDMDGMIVPQILGINRRYNSHIDV